MGWREPNPDDVGTDEDVGSNREPFMGGRAVKPHSEEHTWRGPEDEKAVIESVG